jgi:hypothetical protein
MNRKVDANELFLRVKAHSKENYIFLYSVMKALTMYSAAVALHTIVSGWANGNSTFLIRLPYWLASFAAMILTYIATMVGMLVIAYVPNWEDAVVPFTLAGVEYLLFSVLADSNPNSSLWHQWPLVFAAFCFVCFIKIVNAVRKMRVANYEPDLKELITTYRTNIIKNDIPASGFGALVALIVWLSFNHAFRIPFLRPLIPDISENWQSLFGIPCLVMMIFAIYTAERFRWHIVRTLRQMVSGDKSPPALHDIPQTNNLPSRRIASGRG